LTDEYKTTTIRIDAGVAHRRRVTDNAAQTTIEKARALQFARQETERIASEIAKNVELLEAMVSYRDFLTRLCPEDVSLLEHWHSPDVLLDELYRLESENLFIIEHYNRLNELSIASTVPFVEEFEVTRRQEEMAEELVRGIEIVQEFVGVLTPEQQHEVEAVEEDYNRISTAVRKAHRVCFGGKTDLTPLAILERFETEFERMYDLELGVAPEFKEQKRAAQEKERRELQRKAKHELHLMELQRKVLRAIERAKIPIPRKCGKPVVRRVIPIHERTRACELAIMKKREEERQERLLFGPDLS
jgi:hypothetical protein